jgi:hypothetical protein
MIEIKLFCPYKENPAVKETVKKMNDNIFGSMNKMLNTDIGYQVNNNDISEFLTIKLDTDTLSVKDLIEVIDLYIEKLKEKFSISQIYYKIKIKDE